MEKLIDKFFISCRAKSPNNFDSPINPLNMSFHKDTNKNLLSPPFVRNEKDHMIFEVMRKSRFEYHSFLEYGKIFEDEPNSIRTQQDKETYETKQISYECHNKRGFQSFQYSANNPIEDSIRFFKIPELNAYAVSIFDGHGGLQLSRFCAVNTPKYLLKNIKNSLKLHKYEKNKIQLIKDALKQLHYELQNQYYKQYVQNVTNEKKKYRGVGTCAITLVLYEKTCIVANCGDSQSIVISENMGAYNYHKLCERFSVSNKSQRQRLFQEFKEIDQNIVVEQRRNVFYLKGMLQPTRSIGDYYLKKKEHFTGQGEFKGPYLSCQPDIRVYDLKEHDKYIVVASDGLWDYLTKWQVVKYVIESQYDKINIADRETESETQDQIESRPTQPAEYLGQKILQKVANDFETDIKYLKSLQLGERRSYHDDMTIAVIDIEQFFQGQELMQS